MAKTYVAVLDGVPEAEEGTVDMALGKTSTAEEGWRMVADAAGKAAVTHWRVAAVRDGRAVVVFTPETGRTHQIRVHAAVGHRHPDRRRSGLRRGQGADAAPRAVAAGRARRQAAGRGDRAAAADLRQCAGFGDVL